MGGGEGEKMDMAALVVEYFPLLNSVKVCDALVQYSEQETIYFDNNVVI